MIEMFYRAALMFTFCGMLWFNVDNVWKWKQTFIVVSAEK